MKDERTRTSSSSLLASLASSLIVVDYVVVGVVAASSMIEGNDGFNAGNDEEDEITLKRMRGKSDRRRKRERGGEKDEDTMGQK